MGTRGPFAPWAGHEAQCTKRGARSRVREAWREAVYEPGAKVYEPGVYDVGTKGCLYDGVVTKRSARSGVREAARAKPGAKPCTKRREGVRTRGV